MVISKNENGLFVDSLGNLYNGIAYRFFEYRLDGDSSDFNTSLPQVISLARAQRKFNRYHFTRYEIEHLKASGYTFIYVEGFCFDEGEVVYNLSHCFFSCPLF